MTVLKNIENKLDAKLNSLSNKQIVIAETAIIVLLFSLLTILFLS
jgi:hypothetical protein